MLSKEKIEYAIDFAKTSDDVCSKAKVECMEEILSMIKGEKK